jgi:hypothetical protein
MIMSTFSISSPKSEHDDEATDFYSISTTFTPLTVEVENKVTNQDVSLSHLRYGGVKSLLYCTVSIKTTFFQKLDEGKIIRYFETSLEI